MAVSRVFAEVFGTARSNVEVIRGEKSREKILRIRDIRLDTGVEEKGSQVIRKRLEDCIQR